MPVSITKVNDTTYHVNKKPVIKDMEGNWIAQLELTSAEANTFNIFLYHERKKAALEEE